MAFDKNEYCKIYIKQWRKENPDKLREQNKRHIEKYPEQKKQYREDHKEEISTYNKEHNKEHKEEKAKYMKQYRQSIKGKIARIKDKAKRRQLGFIVLNEYFEGSEAHHISENFVIYIPTDIHKSIWHNIWSWMNMEEINKIAINYI